jgi:hypothetical protein
MIGVRGLVALALTLTMALTVFSLAGCGGGDKEAAEEKVAPASEEVLNEKIDEDLEKPAKTSDESDGSKLTGALSENVVDKIVKENPVIKGKWVNHVYFGVAGNSEESGGLRGMDLAVARARNKAKGAEGRSVDFKEHWVNLNSGCGGSSYIAAVNTFTTNPNDACADFIIRLCLTKGVADMDGRNGIRYTSYDGTDLNAGAGGRYIYLLEGRGWSTKVGNPINEVGFVVESWRDSVETTRNELKTTVFKDMSFNPFSHGWKFVGNGDASLRKAVFADYVDGAVDLNRKAGGDYVYMKMRPDLDKKYPFS